MLKDIVGSLVNMHKEKKRRNFYQTAGNYIKELNGITRDILIADSNDVADVS